MPIRWPIVSVIFRREVRDQLRDRRTLFMIFVLPMLLYPIIVFGAAQLSAAFEQKARLVVVVGAEHLPDDPPLLNKTRDGFNLGLFESEAQARQLFARAVEAKGEWLDPAFRERATRTSIADAVIVIPANLKEQIARKESLDIAVDYDSADDRSDNTYRRLREVLARWQQGLVNRRLAQDALPKSYAEPIKVRPVDVATEVEKGNSLWARLFPFLLVMMSLTGAFYPAVDICAGEKERGTMETLLISPASRAEIVLGKFFTVFVASVTTALLNLICMAITGLRLVQGLAASPTGSTSRRAAAIAMPSIETGIWILLLLIPLAAFFSALCLALAVLAKSMKEGQYYMTPLYLVCVPLVFLSLAPGIELNLFYALLPVTGVALLLRSLILGDYVTGGQYFLPVLVPTCVYGALALRWAVDQFMREDVLFREAERFDLKAWLIHLVRDRGPIPTGGQALFCFAVMLASAWFLTQYLMSLGLGTSTRAMAAGQIGFILGPPLILTLLLTRSPARTLRLTWPDPRCLAVAVGLVVFLNPLVNELGHWVQILFPMSKELKESLAELLSSKESLATTLMLFAVLPGICEELAFRGFILSGLQHAYSTKTAIILSALLFGIMHVLLSLFQQLFNATLLGLVLGLLAVRSGSILPGIVFHVINNGAAVVLGQWVATPQGKSAAAWIYRDVEHGLYHRALVVVGMVVSAVLLTMLVHGKPEGSSQESASSSHPEPAPAV